MRLVIRPEQMDTIQSSAEARFEQRLATHLRARYSKSTVRLPEHQSTVKELSDETLNSLVKASIERARKHGLTYESSISAFSAVMFEVAPNFDAHDLVQPFLADENIAPDERLDPMLEKITDKEWETIKKTYDVEAWHPKTEE